MYHEKVSRVLLWKQYLQILVHLKAIKIFKWKLGIHCHQIKLILCYLSQRSN